MPQLTAVNSNTNGSGQIMQSASSSAGREATKRRLPRYLVVIFTVLLPLGCITFLAACVGTFILTGARITVHVPKMKRPTALSTGADGVFLLADPENKYWISRTRFAELYKRIILANVATNMVAFNGSAYGIPQSSLYVGCLPGGLV